MEHPLAGSLSGVRNQIDIFTADGKRQQAGTLMKPPCQRGGCRSCLIFALYHGVRLASAGRIIPTSLGQRRYLQMLTQELTQFCGCRCTFAPTPLFNFVETDSSLTRNIIFWGLETNLILDSSSSLPILCVVWQQMLLHSTLCQESLWSLFFQKACWNMWQNIDKTNPIARCGFTLCFRCSSVSNSCKYSACVFTFSEGKKYCLYYHDIRNVIYAIQSSWHKRPPSWQ